MPEQTDQAIPGARPAGDPSPAAGGGMEQHGFSSNTSLALTLAWVKQFYGGHSRGYTVRLRRDLWEQLGHEVMMQERCVPAFRGPYVVRLRNVVCVPR